MICYGEPMGGYKKVTANELAKLMVYQKGENAQYWSEDELVPVSKFTKREIDEVERLVDKHIERTRKLFSIEKIEDKVYGND